MLTILPKTVSVSDFQRKIKDTFKNITKSSEPLIVLNRNRQVGVFMNLSKYQELIEIYEDFLDGLRLAEAVKNTKKNDFVSWKKVKNDLKKKNKLPKNF